MDKLGDGRRPISTERAGAGGSDPIKAAGDERNGSPGDREPWKAQASSPRAIAYERFGRWFTAEEPLLRAKERTDALRSGIRVDSATPPRGTASLQQPQTPYAIALAAKARAKATPAT